MRHTNDPFHVLGLNSAAGVEEVRHAYRTLVKKCHPDQFQDLERQKKAQEDMIRLNLAYEEALRLASARQQPAYRQLLPLEEALHLTRKFLRQQNPQGALRQLMRASSRNAVWYALQGEVMMALEQFEAAMESYREAVRRDPNNMAYRRGALDATVALRKSQTVMGKLKHLMKKTIKR